MKTYFEYTITKDTSVRTIYAMEQKAKTYTCNHCGRTFGNAGEWMSHDCDAQTQVQPAQRDVEAILDNAPKCQIEEDGNCLWA